MRAYLLYPVHTWLATHPYRSRSKLKQTICVGMYQVGIDLILGYLN